MGKGRKAIEHQEQEVQPDEFPVPTLDVPEGPVVGYPVGRDDDEADHVAQVLGPQPAKGAGKRAGHLRQRNVRHPDVQHEQGHGDGEYGVAEEDDAFELGAASDPSRLRVVHGNLLSSDLRSRAI